MSTTDQIIELQLRYSEALGRIATLEAALRFYADPRMWAPYGQGYGGNLQSDQGEVARNALGAGALQPPDEGGSW